MFAREGYPFIIGAAALAAIAFAMALRLRSWPLWLAALVLTVVALSVAWFFRNPARVGERGDKVAVASAECRNTLRTDIERPNTRATWHVLLGSQTVIAGKLAT